MPVQARRDEHRLAGFHAGIISGKGVENTHD